jgi:preprotein translocase subunit SecA
MDQLRDGIGLRAYGQRNPIVEYKLEGFAMCEEMVRLMQEDTLRQLYFAMLTKQIERRQEAMPIAATHGGGASSGGAPRRPAKTGAKVGRNDPCPCGSGKKHKQCCGKIA